MCCTSPELRSASSYGHFTAAKEFRSQCHILMWSGLIKVKNPCSGFRVPPISGHQTKVKLPHGTARRVQHNMLYSAATRHRVQHIMLYSAVTRHRVQHIMLYSGAARHRVQHNMLCSVSGGTFSLSGTIIKLPRVF